MAPTRKNLGIGKVAEAEIIKGASDEEALMVVLSYFPDAKTTIKCIEHYRSKLRSGGYYVATSAATRRKPSLRLIA